MLVHTLKEEEEKLEHFNGPGESLHMLLQHFQ